MLPTRNWVLSYCACISTSLLFVLGNLPLRPLIPSNTHTAQGDALIPVAVPHSAAAGSCLPALGRSYHQLSFHPPLTFLPEVLPLSSVLVSFSPHLSQMHCMQCLFLAHTALLTQTFQNLCTSPTKRFKCKAVSEMSVTCHSTDLREEKSRVHRNRAATSME